MPTFVQSSPASRPPAPYGGGGPAVLRQAGAASGGGIGLPSAAAAPAAVSASADPAYLAYLRGVGAEESEVNNILAQRQGALVRQLGRELPAYADRRSEAVEGAGRAAESRGFFRSGARMRDQFRAGRDVDRSRMNFEAGVRDQLGELSATNALDIARLRRGLAEQGITSAQNVTLANAEAGIF